MKYFVVILVISLSINSYGENLSDKTVKTTHVNLSGGYYFKTVEAMVDPEGCGSTSWYRLSNEDFGREAFSLLLAAHMSGKKVSFNIDGCAGNYPSVRWINVYS